MAVLPTPGSPIRTGLFFLRRASTSMVFSISCARPSTGSSLPSRASDVRSRPNLSSVGVPVGVSTRPSSAPLPTTLTTFCRKASGVTPYFLSNVPAILSGTEASPINRCSGPTYECPKSREAWNAELNTFFNRGEMLIRSTGDWSCAVPF
ncbi:hypothetical protein D3C75_1043220 [compost metagenome]